MKPPEHAAARDAVGDVVRRAGQTPSAVESIAQMIAGRFSMGLAAWSREPVTSV